MIKKKTEADKTSGFYLVCSYPSYKETKTQRKIVNVFLLLSKNSEKSQGQFAFTSCESCFNNSSNTFFILPQEIFTRSDAKCAIKSSFGLKQNIIWYLHFEYAETEKLFTMDVEGKT